MLDLFHYGGGKDLFPPWNKRDFWIVLPCPYASAGATIHGDTDALSTITKFHPSGRGTHFIEQDVQREAQVHGINWSYHILLNSENAAKRTVPWLTENWLWHHLGNHTLKNWGVCMTGCCTCFKSQTIICGAVYLIARIHGSGNQEVGVGVALLTIMSNYQLAQLRFASWQLWALLILS